MRQDVLVNLVAVAISFASFFGPRLRFKHRALPEGCFLWSMAQHGPMAPKSSYKFSKTAQLLETKEAPPAVPTACVCYPMNLRRETAAMHQWLEETLECKMLVLVGNWFVMERNFQGKKGSFAHRNFHHLSFLITFFGNIFANSRLWFFQTQCCKLIQKASKIIMPRSQGNFQAPPFPYYSHLPIQNPL